MDRDQFQQEIFSAKPVILIYRNRAGALIEAISLLIILLILLWLLSHSNELYEFVAIGLWVEVFVYIWIIWMHSTRMLFVNGPALVINEQGIQISPLPITTNSDLFLSWDEIGSIALHRNIFTSYLSIRPKNTKLYCSQFRGWKRFILRIKGTRILIFQKFLQGQMRDRLLQMADIYANELKDAHILL